MALDHLDHAIAAELGRERDPRDRLVHAHVVEVVLREVSRNAAVHHDAALVGAHREAALGDLAADAVDDHIDPPAVCQLLDLQGKVLLDVVDAMVGPKFFEAIELCSARRGGEDRRAGTLRELDGGQPHAARARLDEYRLARLQVAVLEEAVVGGAIGDRDRRGLFDRIAVGYQEALTPSHLSKLCVRPEREDRGDPLARLALGHLGADLDDGSRRLVADAVRCRCHDAAGATQDVAALDAHRLDANRDALGMTLGIRHVFVAEDVGPTGFVVDGCLHGGSPCWGKRAGSEGERG